MRNASFYSSKRVTHDEALLLEQRHLEYESLVHDMFCDPRWVAQYGKQKKLRVLTYCMYYQGITARQLLLTNITPEAELDSERVFLGRLATNGLLQASSFRLPGNEPAVIYLLTRKGATFCRDKLLHLIRTRGLPVKNETVEAVYTRFCKLAPVNSVGHFLSVRDIHAYFLSQFSSVPFHYGIECGVYLSGDVMSIAESLTGAMSGGRRRQIPFVSDAILTYPSSDMTAMPDRVKTAAQMNYTQEPFSLQADTTLRHDAGIDIPSGDNGNPSVNGSPVVPDNHMDSNNSNSHTAAHPSKQSFWENPLRPENCYVYIEQDMSTQHLNVISGKIGNYTRIIAMQQAHPARHTLLFSLQTRPSDLSDKPLDNKDRKNSRNDQVGKEDRSNENNIQTAALFDTAPRKAETNWGFESSPSSGMIADTTDHSSGGSPDASSDAAAAPSPSSFGMAPIFFSAGGSDTPMDKDDGLTDRSNESVGGSPSADIGACVYDNSDGSSIFYSSMDDSDTCNGSPDMSRYFRQECLSSVPAVAYAYYGSTWTDTSLSVLADIYESFNGNIGYMERKYANAARTLRLAASDMPDMTVGDFFDAIADYAASLGEEKENQRETRHHALYLARRATFKKAVANTEGLHEMFLSGFSIATSHNRAHERIVPFILPQISPDMVRHLQSLCNLYLGTDFNEVPRYRDYVGSKTSFFVLRNCYTWSNGVSIYLENISDDFGGKARLFQYLSDGQWDGPDGYLICLVADDDTDYLKEIQRTVYYKTLTGKQQLVAPLKVAYITYSQFTQARGLSMYHIGREDDPENLADILNCANRGKGLVPLLPYGYRNNDMGSSR